MKYKIELLLCLVLLFSQLSVVWAGHEAGGGHVVVCKDLHGEIKSIQLLEYFEAEQLWNIHYDLSQANTYSDKIRLALSRFSKLDPARMARYASQFQAFEKDAIRKKGVTLVNIPDTGHLAFPTNCTVEQLITQTTPQFPQDRRYLINQDLWESAAFDEDNKAGIILHELIYREAKEEGHIDSRFSRYFNAHITANKLTDMSQKQYIKLLETVKFKSYMAFGWLSLSNIENAFTFFPDGQIAEIDGTGQGNVTVASHTGVCSVDRYPPITFHPNGNLQFCPKVNVEKVQAFELANHEKLSISATPGVSYRFAPILYPDGNLQALCYSYYPPPTISMITVKLRALMTVQEKKVSFNPNRCNGVKIPPLEYLAEASIELYSSGAIKRGFVAEPVKLKSQSGQIILFANQVVFFNENGLVSHWLPPQ